MKKYELLEDTNLTAKKGSIIIIDEQQASVLGAKVKEVKEVKKEVKEG